MPKEDPAELERASGEENEEVHVCRGLSFPCMKASLCLIDLHHPIP